MKGTIFAALAAVAAGEDMCTETFMYFKSSMDDFSVSDANYQVACDAAIPAAQDCYDLATECATEAYKFYEVRVLFDARASSSSGLAFSLSFAPSHTNPAAAA